jgi:hypothetical protein
MQPASDGRLRERLALPGRAGVALLALGAGLVAAAGIAVAASGWQPVSALALIAGALLMIGVGARSWRRARVRRLERLLAAWGRDRGLLLLAAHGNPGSTALLRSVGRLGPVLIGPLADDPHGLVGHCATLADGREDPHGAPFTVAVLRVPAVPGLAIRIGAHAPVLAAVVDDWRPLATESAAVDARRVIEVRDGHDPLAVRALLRPAVLEALLADDPGVGVEIEEGWLVAWLPGHVGARGAPPVADGLERLLAGAGTWAERVRAAAG